MIACDDYSMAALGREFVDIVLNQDDQYWLGADEQTKDLKSSFSERRLFALLVRLVGSARTILERTLGYRAYAPTIDQPHST